MNTIEHLRDLFAYNDWANRRIITALKETDSLKSVGILSHLLIAEHEYFVRLHGKDSTESDFWQQLSIAECGDTARETAERYEKLLRRFDDEGLDLKAKYRTSKGVQRENTFREILTQVLFHSAIHRGSIVLKLREEGFTPPATDYIIYLRETKYL